MILVFALAGIFTATVAGVTALIMGQPWWIGLVSYIGTGMLTVFILAIFVTFAMKTTARRAGTRPLGGHLPLAEH
jgi:putative flippase GtrA